MRKSEIHKEMALQLFDVENQEDLPDECKKEIAKPGMRGFQDKTIKLVGLFKYKPILTEKEIIAGMYRLHKMTVNLTWVKSTTANLVLKKIIQKTKQGEYKTVAELPPEYKDR